MDDKEEFGPLESADEVSTLKERISTLEQRERELLQRQKENEEDFGQKRARFRELFLQKEAELKQEKQEHHSAEEKVDSLEKELKSVQEELNDIKAAIAVSESNKEEEIDKIRRQFQQELASLQSLMSEAADEGSRSTAVHYENERMKLQELNEKYEKEIHELRSKLSQEREGFLSSVAKSFKNIHVGGSASPITTQEEDNLEDSMRKAQSEAQVLRSVVLPLEEEISALKTKLKESQLKVQELDRYRSQVKESGGGEPVLNNDLVSPTKTTSLPSLDDITDPEEKVQQLMQYLKAEKASRSDLEMYVAVLSTQKNVQEDEADNVRKELKEVCKLLDDEKKSHEQLKQTWQMANDQFLESQRLMMMDMRRIETVLTAEQQRQIAELQEKDREREAQEKKVKELEELRQRQEQQQEEQRKQEALKKVEESTKKLKKKEAKLQAELLKMKSESKNSINSLTSEDSVNFDELNGGLKKSLSSSEITGLNEADFLDGGEHETRSLNEMDGMTVRISPEKVINMPLLTEAQMKAITDPTPESEARKSLMATAKMRSQGISLQGRRIVSDKEWMLLQDELKAAREKLGRPCDMCKNYEAQLQSVQTEMKEEQTKVRSLDRQLTSETQITASQKAYITELENSLKDNAEDAHKQISSLATKVQESEKYAVELKQQFTQSQVQFHDVLKELTASREEVQKELTRLQKENDSLCGKNLKHAQQIQNEDINLPTNIEDLQLLLLKYREDIITARVGQEHTEETLRSQIIFLKDQVQAEQQEKTTIEETLSQEISGLQEKLVVQESLKSELERESSVRAEAESKARELEHHLKGQTAKSKQLINALQKQVEEQSNARTKYEQECQSLKNKVQSLQVDLDNSEAVQRDFVKLSQSLQIQLEKIRQAETEVRWQHEEDVDDCSNCKQPFSVTRRKHHCKHCGRIFCSDCTNKTVNSGPNLRPSKVCDVCHTILVKDATPYFSTEPPNTPD